MAGGDTSTAATHIHGGTDMYDELTADLTPDESLDAGDGKVNQ